MVIGFIASALLVVSVALPSGANSEKRRGVYDRARAGFRIFMATPRLRGVMALNLVVSLAGAMVIVNRFVLVQGQFGLTDQHTAMALAAFGGGSMLAALALPALFAAQFSLSHAGWLFTYPLAGWLGSTAGMTILV